MSVTEPSVYWAYAESTNRISGANAFSGRGAIQTSTHSSATCARMLSHSALMPSSANGTYTRKLSAGYDCCDTTPPLAVGVTRFGGTPKSPNAGCMFCTYGLAQRVTSSAEYALKSIASVPYVDARNSV